MHRPAEPSLRPAAAGAAEARQPDRDLAEQGGDPMGAVILTWHTAAHDRQVGRRVA